MTPTRIRRGATAQALAETRTALLVIGGAAIAGGVAGGAEAGVKGALLGYLAPCVLAPVAFVGAVLMSRNRHQDVFDHRQG